MRGVALAVLLLALACASPEPAGPGISPQALAERIAAGDAPLVLDVRTQAEYDAGHVPGAVLIPHDALAGRLGELAGREGEEIVVHCKSGRRAAYAEDVLREAGFTHLIELEGHWQAWEAGAHPTER